MPPPTKRRKTDPTAVEEITFDLSARQEYLTGFHKRKLERARHARDLAEKQARQEKLEARQQLRKERRADLERHVAEVNAFLKPTADSDASGSDEDEAASEEWNGIEEISSVDHEAEYIDEDKYTTVMVEAMDLSKEGLQQAEQIVAEQLKDSKVDTVEDLVIMRSKEAIRSKKRVWTKEKPEDWIDKMKKKKKKFRYETKAERKVTRMKQGARNGREAKARRER